MTSSPSAASHRLTVDICPALYVGSTSCVSSCTQRSRSLVFSRCSRAIAGEPFASYQSAAAQVQLHDGVGLDAPQLAEQELPEQRVVPVPLPPAVERDQERVRRLERLQPVLAARICRAARRRAGRAAGRARRFGAGSAGSPGPAGSATRGRGSRPRSGRRRRPSSRPGAVSRAIIAASCRPAGQPSVRSMTSVAWSSVSGTCDIEKICSAPPGPRARSAASSSSASPEARIRGRCGCSARLAVTSCEPAGMPEITTPSTS